MRAVELRGRVRTRAISLGSQMRPIPEACPVIASMIAIVQAAFDIAVPGVAVTMLRRLGML